MQLEKENKTCQCNNPLTHLPVVIRIIVEPTNLSHGCLQ